jgi:hypothetical protein
VSDFKEHAHTFGDGKILLGVATVPTVPDPSRPAIVVLNAGLIHRVGPFRLNVDIARTIAGTGSIVFRIDQSALGDSGDRPGGLSYEARALVDGKEAMDFLAQQYKVERFILVGLCSGAMNAHRIAIADDRVVGVCFLDAYAYTTPTVWRKRLFPRLVNPKNWALAVRRLKEIAATRSFKAASSTSSTDDGPGADAVEIFAQDWPPKTEVRRDLDKIVARGTRLFFVYTGGWSDYVHEGQFDEMFPGLRQAGKVDVRFFRDADHTFVLVNDREALLGEIKGFVGRVE